MLVQDLGNVSVEADSPATLIKPPDLHSETAAEDPTTATEDGSEWTGETNVTASNDSYATYNDTTQAWLQVQGFDLSAVPAGARIFGIAVTVEGNGDSATPAERGIDVQLRRNGSQLGDTKTLTLNQTTDTTQTLGGEFDVWGQGRVLKEDVLADDSLEVWIRKTTATAAVIDIDHVTVTIHYTEDPTVKRGGQRYVKYNCFVVDATAASLTEPGGTAMTGNQAVQNGRIDDDDFFAWPGQPRALYAASTSTVEVACKGALPA